MKLVIQLKYLLGLIGLMIIDPMQCQTTEMTNEKIHLLVLGNSAEVKGQLGQWEAYVANQTVFVITAENFNRMRIISPITEDKELSSEEMKVLLEANFDRALDSKYSIHNGYLWSTFTHPLKELTDAQFVDALQQVVTLANNFGTTYISTDLIFGSSSQQGSDQK